MIQKSSKEDVSKEEAQIRNNVVSLNLSSEKKLRMKKKNQHQSLYVIGYNLLSKRISFLFSRLYMLNEKLTKAAMPIPYEVYVSGMVFFSMIASVVGLGTGIGISLLFGVQPEFYLILPIAMAFFFAELTFLFMYIYPSMNIATRKGKIDVELPYFTSYMSSLASSNLTIEEIFKAVAKDDQKFELVKDANHLLRNVEILGMDIVTAILELGKRSPSGSYSEFLEGLVTSLRTGGSMKELFLATAEVQMEEKKMQLSQKVATLAIITELYTILLIVAPLMGIIVLSIMAIMSTELGGVSLDGLIALLTYVMVPMFGIMLLLMMDQMVPKR